jgi:hypothetical protein
LVPFAWMALLAIIAAVQQPTQSSGELAFELTRYDLLTVDTTAIRWTTLSTYVGGVDAEFVYSNREVMPNECRGAALIGMVRLRNYYRQEQRNEPVTMRMDFQCGLIYRGGFRYDGVNARLEIVEITSGESIYQGRRRGLP